MPPGPHHRKPGHAGTTTSVVTLETCWDDATWDAWPDTTQPEDGWGALSMWLVMGLAPGL